MLQSKTKAIQTLLFALIYYQHEKQFFSQQSNWTEENISIYKPTHENDLFYKNFTLNKTKLDITHLWASSTLIDGLTLYIHPTNTDGSWTLIGATTRYDHNRSKDKGPILGLFYTDFLQEKHKKTLIEGHSPTSIMTHFVYQLGNIETNHTKFLTTPYFIQPTYKVFYEDRSESDFTYMTQPQILQSHPCLIDVFGQITSPSDFLDIKYTLAKPGEYFSIRIIRDLEGEKHDNNQKRMG